jgi:hypothetical protein
MRVSAAFLLETIFDPTRDCHSCLAAGLILARLALSLTSAHHCAAASSPLALGDMRVIVSCPYPPYRSQTELPD